MRLGGTSPKCSCVTTLLPAAEEKEEIIQTWLDKKRLESLFHRKRKKLIRKGEVVAARVLVMVR